MKLASFSLSALSVFAFAEVASALPGGYVELKDVTIPITAEKPKDAVVLPNVQWKDVRSIHFRYSTTNTTATSAQMLFSGATSLSAASYGDPWYALKGTKATGSSLELQTSAATASLTKTPGDAYDRDGSVHELTISITGGGSVSSTSYVQFGGGWGDTSWNGTVTFYELQFLNAGGDSLATLVPCRESATGKIGFYDTVAGAFRTKLLDSWLDFIPGKVAQEAGQIVVSGSPENLGTVSPAYGVSPIATDGSETTFSVVQTAYDDDRTGVVVADGQRAFLKDCKIAVDDVSVKTSVETPFAYAAPGDYDSLTAVWSFTNEQYRTVAIACAGGTVTLGDVTASPVTNWTAVGSSLRLTATPDATHRFVAWTGDVEGIDAASKVLILPVTQARTLTATYEEKPQRDPVTSAWVGASGADWADPESWDNGVPSDGDTAILSSDAALTINLTASTAELGKLVISNAAAKAATTLVCSNWFTKIRATDVVIGKGGVITCAGPFTNADMSNRVHIVAENLDIQAGGKIDVNEKGYSCTNGPCWTAEIAASAQRAGIYKHCGAAYGGRQGYDNMLYKGYDGYFRVFPEPQPYGNPAAPLDPGSGAGAQPNYLGKPGGGAIRLEVGGRLTVDGTISANGGSIWSGVYGGASGGGIYVTCQTVAGTGSVTANGGGIVGNTVTGGGSGGRMAVLYDAASQPAADCRVRFEARSGCNHYNNRAAGIREPGTLYFTDNQFLTSSAYLADGWKFAGRWMSAAGTPASLAIDGDLTLAASQLAFTEIPFVLDVTGDLVMTGSLERADITWFSNATITVGGALKIDSNRLELYGGSLSVGGDMLLQTNGTTRCGSELAVRAAATNDPSVAYGATVSVDGTVTLGNNAMISPWAHEKNGAVVGFSFGDFVLDAGASVNADEKGYRSGFGPGKPTATSDNAGASHGGRGGSISDMAHVASVCDSEEYPVQPGSSANREAGDAAQSWHGGGAVLISAARTMTLNGTISANGNANVQFWYTGTAGGTVNLKAPVVSGTTGQILAKGGNRNEWDKGSYGGGGRIALGCRQDKTSGVKFNVDSLDVSSDPRYAESGTVYTYMLPPQPNTFTVSATPAEVGASAISPAYGDYLALTPGEEILCTASTDPIDLGDAVGVIRGWKLYETDADNNLLLVDEASTNAYRYVHQNGKMYRFVWQIMRTYAVTILSNEPSGADVYADGLKLSVGMNYVPESDAVVFSAETKDGYSVFCWSGADFDDVQAPSVTLPLHAARTISLVLTDANHVASAATWSGTAGGKWTDLTKWADGAFPQAGDAVTLGGAASQTITLGVSTPALGSLTVANTASGTTKLLLSKWDTCVRADAITVGAGGVIAVEGAFKDNEMSNRVHLAGTSLTVASGGKILADRAGYAKRNGPAWVGASSQENHDATDKKRNEFAGAYGGEQAYPVQNGRYADTFLIPPHAYGSVTAPLDPGSGGGEYAGGGAIRLDFSGAVTIDGLVSAAGETGTLNTGGPGSGGAVFITCSTIAGSGEVKANGRDAAVNAAVNLYGGAGGRVAVVYDTTAQDAVDCRVRFEARGGISYTTIGDAVNGSGHSFVPDIFSEDGTLYFPDSRFLTTGSYRANGLRFAGQWKAPLAGSVIDFGEGDLLFDRTHLVLPAGVSFAAGGNVTMTGLGPRPAENGLIVSNANATVGGNLILRDARVELRGGDLTVGGNLVQEANDGVTYTDNDYGSRKTGGGELCFHPAPTNEIAGIIGARLNVGGNWTMSVGSATYPFSHPTDGSIAALQVEGDFTLANEAYVVGDMRGYAGFNGPGRKPGQNTVGASHGGKGSYDPGTPSTSNNVAATYGSFKRPLTPGTGGAGGANSDYGVAPTPGGSVIYLVAGRNMTLNGYIGACGTTDNHVRYWMAASSGGSIYLKAWRLKDGTPTVTAKGGMGSRHGGGYGIGGGGRIAVHYAAHDIADFEAYKACFLAEKGVDNSKKCDNTAEDGTVYWHKFGGLSIIVR